MWVGLRARTAVAGGAQIQIAAPVVKLSDDDSSVEHAAAALANGTAPPPTGTGLLPAAMGDLFSLSLLQVLSLLSFLTSLLVGSVSLHRLSQHKSFVEAAVPRPEPAMHGGFRFPSWGLTGLPVSFALNTLIGEDEAQQPEAGEKRHVGPSRYIGGADLVRMPIDWHVNRARTVPAHPQHSQPPLSMAKLLMSRQLQRKAPRVPRRIAVPGMPRPTPPSRLAAECVV